MTNNDDLYLSLTNQMISEMQKGARPWVSHIERHANIFIHGGLPINGATRKRYAGRNIGILLLSAWINGFDLPYWMSYRQAAALGGQVCKGSKGTKIVHFDWVPKKDAGGNVVIGSDGKPDMYAKTTTATVFNARQIKNLPEHLTSPVKAVRMPDEGIDAFFANIGATVYHKVNATPVYRSQADTITIPPLYAFVDANAYYATLAHEHGHWTMAKDRLNRRYTKQWIEALVGKAVDSPEEGAVLAYAAEELVAEMAAAFVCALLGIEPVTRANSVAYLASYVRVLKVSPDILVKVMSLAAAAADYLMEKGKGSETALTVVTARDIVVAGPLKSKTPRSVLSQRAKKAARTRRENTVRRSAETHTYAA